MPHQADGERAPSNGELASIVFGDTHESVDLGAEQLQKLQSGPQNEATGHHIAELLAARPDLQVQYGLGVHNTGRADIKAAVFDADGKIEYYDF